MIEMKTFVLNWDDLAEQDFSHYMTESEYIRYKQKWWISVNKSGDQGSVVYIKPFTPRSLLTTTQAHAPLEVTATATVIEFFLHLVAMEWILVVFIRIQRMSMKEDTCKDL